LRITRVTPTPIEAGKTIRILGDGFQQGSAHPYTRNIVVSNSGSQDLKDYQVLVRINTQALIAEGKMQTNGRDLRFMVNGTNIPYWIQSGINTAVTRIWLRVPNIPTQGTATITMGYGNPVFGAQSNPNNVFLLYDTFGDGQRPGWITDFSSQSPGVTVEETGGAMLIKGTANQNNMFNSFGFYLNQGAPEISNLPPDIAIDSEVDINRGTSRGKISAGGFDGTIAAYDTPIGTPPQKRLGFWNGGAWESIGSSRLGTTNVTKKIFTFSLSRQGSSANVAWQEDYNPEVLTQRSGLNNPYWGYFNYAPWTTQPFQVKFKWIGIRRSNQEGVEPTVAGTAETTNTQIQVFFDGVPATRVWVDSTQQIRATATVAATTIRVVNPNGESVTFSL